VSNNFKLIINNISINAHPFIRDFIEHTISGMIEALKGTEEIKNLNLYIAENRVTLNLNGALIPTNVMTSNLIKNTVMGMVSILHQIDDIISLNITFQK
jgi:hypothetical protein